MPKTGKPNTAKTNKKPKTEKPKKTKPKKPKKTKKNNFEELFDVRADNKPLPGVPQNWFFWFWFFWFSSFWSFCCVGIMSSLRESNKTQRAHFTPKPNTPWLCTTRTRLPHNKHGTPEACNFHPLSPGGSVYPEFQRAGRAFHCCSVWQLEKAAVALMASRRKSHCRARPRARWGMLPSLVS